MSGKVVIKAKWTTKTREYYEYHGYLFTQYEDLFEVNENDFSQSSKMKVYVECQHCKDYFEMEFRSYCRRLDKHSPIFCKKCIEAKKIDDLYKQVIDICHQRTYELITTRDEIINQKTEIYYICPKHGKTHTKICSLIDGKGCYWCGRDRAAIQMVATTLEPRRQKLYNNALSVAKKNGYILVSKVEDIINNKTYIQYICPKHGLHSMRISNFINGKGCPDCVRENNRNLFQLSPDEVEQRIHECGGRLLNKHDYKNQTEKNLWIECFECGKPFLTSLRNFTQHDGQVCASCQKTKSLGEIRIKHYLENKKINFISQKWFADCRDANPLPFDFYLFDYNTVIEFDGRQHFEETGHFAYPLEIVQKHDKIKNIYCKEHNIYLIRIPYWNYNKIEEILDKELILHEDIV